MTGELGFLAKSVERFKDVLVCARSAGLRVVDPYDMLSQMVYGSEGTKEVAVRKYWLYPDDPHMSPAENRLMAEVLASALVSGL